MTLISNELIRMVNFSTRITDSNSHSPDLLDLFIFSDAIICSTLAFSPYGHTFMMATKMTNLATPLPRSSTKVNNRSIVYLFIFYLFTHLFIL